MPERSLSIKLQIKNIKALEEVEKAISTTEGFHLQPLEDGRPCHILILEIGEDLEKEFQLIRALHDSGEVGAIFVTSPRFEAEVLVQALRAGVKEFLSQPLKREELVSALLRVREGRPSIPEKEEKRKKGKIIYVVGGKGGVGTTTVAVNLSTSLADSNGSRSVVLMDMNLVFGEIPIFLDLKSDFSWGEVVKNISRVDTTYLKSILAKHPSGVFVLPSPTGLDGTLATPEVIATLLKVMQETFDFIVIDGGQLLDEISLKILELSETVLVVSILSLPCLTNVKRLLWTFQKLGYPRTENVKILINRYHKKSLISLEEAERSIEQKIFWQIPNDFGVTMSAINQGKVLSRVDSGAEITKSLQKLAFSFLEEGKEGSPEQRKGGFWGKILK